MDLLAGPWPNDSRHPWPELDRKAVPRGCAASTAGGADPCDRDPRDRRRGSLYWSQPLASSTLPARSPQRWPRRCWPVELPSDARANLKRLTAEARALRGTQATPTILRWVARSADRSDSLMDVSWRSRDRAPHADRPLSATGMGKRNPRRMLTTLLRRDGHRQHRARTSSWPAPWRARACVVLIVRIGVARRAGEQPERKPRGSLSGLKTAAMLSSARFCCRRSACRSTGIRSRSGSSATSAWRPRRARREVPALRRSPRSLIVSWHVALTRYQPGPSAAASLHRKRRC
jgi:hypothetical protein